MNAKKLIALLLAVVMVFGLVACNGGGSDETTAPNGETTAPNGDTTGNETVAGLDYTYHAYATSLGTNWNPHTWEMSGDSDIMAYIETPLADMTIKDSTTGEYQWIFLAAEDIIDVTAEHQDDLVKYGANTGSADPSTVTEGYVYEIKLRPEMVWADGTPINADTYIYSMQQLLDPKMHNYRANNYYSGESAIAGAEEYYWGGSVATLEAPDLSAAVKGEDGVYTTAEGGKIYIALTSGLSWLGGNSLADYVGAYGEAYFDVEAYAALEAVADENGNVALTDETLANIIAVISVPDWGEGAGFENNYMMYEKAYPEVGYDETVGVYKVDEYTIRYVCEAYYDYYYFLTSCTSNWIVYEDLYEAGKDTSGELVTTNYGTSVETTMSYGPYLIESLQDGKQIVFAQNPAYFEYTVADNGAISSTTEAVGFTVDGEYVDQFQTQKVVIDVMTDDAAKQAFMKGEIDSWTPAADEVVNYTTSTQLYQVDETYTMRLFFNCGLDNLKKMDESYGNTNSVVLSNINFRKALSLAIDRDEFVTATAGYKAAYYILNYLYFYDVYEDPASIYRNTDEAMQAICNLYGVEYGEGTPYATLADAYNSINGYNLTEAKALLTQACSELVAEGLYTEGDPVVIRIGWSKGAMGSSDQQQVTLLNEYINAAAEGTGFGTITLEAVDNLPDRYASVANGEFAIGWGAWGGAAFYPFTMFRVYCDPDYTSIHEIGSWDPASTNLTLNVNGEEVTMTWQQWSVSMTGTGAYADADNETKLAILAGMEEEYLKLYYCIPMCTTTACYLLSYKVSYYTEEYNIMYGFGGTRLMSYNYTDAEWAEYVASQGGTLSYE